MCIRQHKVNELLFDKLKSTEVLSDTTIKYCNNINVQPAVLLRTQIINKLKL